MNRTNNLDENPMKEMKKQMLKVAEVKDYAKIKSEVMFQRTHCRRRGVMNHVAE